MVRLMHRWMLRRAAMQGTEEFGDRQDSRELLGALPYLQNQSQLWIEAVVGPYRVAFSSKTKLTPCR